MMRVEQVEAEAQVAPEICVCDGLCDEQPQQRREGGD
jgi:hypothetical protein